MYNVQLGAYVWHPTTKYVVLDNGKHVKRKDISDDEYYALKEWGCIVKEYEK